MIMGISQRVLICETVCVHTGMYVYPPVYGVQEAPCEFFGLFDSFASFAYFIDNLK